MRTILCTLVIMFGFGPAQAAVECVGTTVDRVGCYADAQEAADKTLNANYQALMELIARTDAALAEQLRVAQRTWLKFRDQNCDTYDALDLVKGGFMRAECVINMTSDRAAELEEILGYAQQWN
jgi:uncharacterized protein YecT (DUF1311 family)